jgi:Leucine-rich repeat (LRR) protein
VLLLQNDGWCDKDATLFTMHDLAHDLARAILADQVNDKGNAGGNRCRYALLTDCTKPLQLSVTSPANIIALHFLDCRELELRGDAFLLATCLRVLDLNECLIGRLPDSIGRLKQLRFLHAPRIQDQMIPSCITELSELNYLNLRGSRNISRLPESIGDMKGLMLLDLSGCSGIRELPISFTELKQLVHLDLSNCRMSISEAFGGFSKLQYLNLSINSIKVGDRRGLPAIINNLIKLRYLNLSGCIKAMVPPAENQSGSLLNSISTLSNLEHLDLSENEELSSIPESIGNLGKLHTLDLSGCFCLNELPDSIGKMVCLKVLNVGRCSPWFDTSRLNVALLPHFVVHPSSDKYNSNIILLQPTNPDELTIERLKNVKSAEEAQRIKLIEKQNIKELIFLWSESTVRFVDDKEVLEKLVPPSSVQILHISGYRSVSFPDWLMGIGQFLPCLLEIDLSAFAECKNLPPFGELPNLRFLRLFRMESLEEWNMTHSSDEEGANNLVFPKLETLRIMRCVKLRIKSCLPRAKSLIIEDCDNVLSSWGESSSHTGASFSSPITDLFVEDSKLPLYQWRLFRQLPALRSSTIKRCSDLTTSPEIIQHLSSLQTLVLDHPEPPRWLVELTSLQELSLCSRTSMTSLPQWLGELVSLKKFEIWHGEGIRALPDSIQQLTKLENLCIYNCPILMKWCESKENSMKLAHVQTLVCAYQAFILARNSGYSFFNTNRNMQHEYLCKIMMSKMRDDYTNCLSKTKRIMFVIKL